jgi:hypothetical protein
VRRPSKRTARKQAKIGGVITFIAIVCILSISIGSSVNSAIMIANTPEDIVPTNLAANPITMDVFKINGQPLASNIIATNGKATYNDPNNVYSPIQAICSDTWLSDINAVPIPDGHAPAVQQSWALPIYSGSHVYAIQVVYRYIIWMTVEVVIRSGPTNTFAYTPSTTYVSPFEGVSVNGYNRVMPGLVTMVPPAAYTRGALTMWQYSVPTIDGTAYPSYQTNTMASPFGWWTTSPITTNAPYAAVTTSVVPYTSWQDMIVATTNPAFSTLTESRLTTVASAIPVVAKVTVHVVANTEQIRTYGNDFTYTLANGTVATVSVDTVSAVVGFSGSPNGLRSTGTYTGMVPNTNPIHQVPTFDLSDATVTRTNDIGADTAASSTTTNMPDGGSRTITGSMVARSVFTQEVLAARHVVGTPTGTMQYTTGTPAENLEAPSVIDLTDVANNCTLPQTLDITASNTMGPKVTASGVFSQLTTQSAYERGGYPRTWVIDTTTKNIQWAYGIKADNTMTAQNFTFPVDVVSERSVQLFSSDGRPIDLTTIVDTDGNSIFADPRTNNVWVKQQIPDLPKFDFWAWIWSLLMALPWWVNLIIILVIVVIVLWLLSKVWPVFRKIGGGLKSFAGLFKKPI